MFDPTMPVKIGVTKKT
jgi:hypothetical protein